ncbi:MAG: hydrogenobyrinic acid a,c-diamide synthase (glutamine-hydrolyzing) [Candidatus Krumholzibacteria bacterium]|nr:hydrogenobyrinic acid a,c-diamide synthase (glutamine-hydrolyzing) [Candidatus Krumholzibacteria bacterium]
MATSLSRLVIAGLSGDSGKTIVSLSFVVALKRKGHSVSVFKKGPDYIDPAWLSMVTRRDCRNLDTYMVAPEVVRQSFVDHGRNSDIAVVEGNRGLYDGRDATGTNSTAELAKLIDSPVVLVVNAAKTTRTIAALVRGCQTFDPEVKIAGVILNRIAGTRHLRVLTDSIEKYCGIPIVGAIPKLGDDSTLIPGRHLGLITPSEYQHDKVLRSRLEEIAEAHLDVDGMISIAETAEQLDCDARDTPRRVPGKVKIGYFKDSVFTFYYPENLEALEAEGADLVPVSSLDDKRLPDVDALYIGGGFPETHAEQLAGNRSMMESVRKAADNGLPVYAECGGLIYLARSLKYGDAVYEMAGVFEIDLEMHGTPVGHGYTLVEVDSPSPFYPVGTKIRGHEFHYTGPSSGLGEVASCMAVETGTGVGNGRDGLIYKNTLACYTHVHADGVDSWASSMVSRAAYYAKTRTGRRTGGGGGNN